MESAGDSSGGINNKEILDVRKVIERSTSKVSLRDLEKKGFRQVKVLRAGDINQLIYKAVQTVLAKNPVGGGVSEAERQRILDEAKNEYEKQLKVAQDAQRESARIEEAHKNLEQKLAQVNAQIQARTAAFAEEKRQFEREKQSLYEKGLDGVNNATKHYQAQIDELKAKLDEAEARAKASQGAVSEDAYKDLEERAKNLESKARAKVEDLERQLRTANHELQMSRDDEAKQRGRASELDGETKRLREKSRDLEVEAGKAEVLRARVADLEAELAKGGGEDMNVLHEELAQANQRAVESEQRMQEMMKAVMAKLAEAPAAAPAAGASPDLTKQLQAFQQGLTDQMRKIAGSSNKGSGFDSDISLAGLSLMGEDVKLETNINDVSVKQQSAKGVKDKLSKLRNMRGGGAPK